MKAKPTAPEEFRMPAAEFDKMMRGALSAHPPKEEGKPKSARKAAKKPKTEFKR